MAQHDIQVKQGATFKMRITLRTTAGFVPIQDYTFTGMIKNSIYDKEGFPFTFQKTDEPNGAFLVIMNGEDTAQLDFKDGVYEIFYTIDGQERFSLLEGDVTVDLGVL